MKEKMFKQDWFKVSALIFLAMVVVFFVALAIKIPISDRINYLKSSLGATVLIENDINVKTADKITSTYSDYIKSYSYEIYPPANSGELDFIEVTDADGNLIDAIKMVGDENSDSELLPDNPAIDSNIAILGINIYAYIDGTENQTIAIKDGTSFDENSKSSALVSSEFAELNSLKVGDIFDLRNVYTQELIPLTLVGIYKNSKADANPNTVFMDIDSATKFLGPNSYNDGNYTVSNVYYYLFDSSQAKEFIDKANTEITELAENDSEIIIDTSEYNQLTSPLQPMNIFSTIMLVISIITMISIIIFVIRKYPSLYRSELN